MIFAFAILVIIHEFGHFLFARIFGVKVEKFYIFFNPWTSLVKWKPGKYVGFFGKTRELKGVGATGDDVQKKPGFWSDTEYGVGWLPLGGYCKIAGMIDESMDLEQMKQPAQKWEFRSKPAWQRLLIMVAGVLFNFLLAILIYAGITWWWGDDYVPFKETRGMIKYSDVARQYGYRDGDIPLMADGKELTGVDDLYDLGMAGRVRVLREGKDTLELAMPENFMLKLDRGAAADSRNIPFMIIDIPVVVHSVNSARASEAGLHPGDEIVAINDTVFHGASEFLPALAGRPGHTVNLTVLRKGAEAAPDTLRLPVKLDENSKIGFQLENNMRKLYNVKTVRYGLLESIPVGISKGVGKMKDYVSSLKLIFTKEGAQSVGGFGAIGSMFPDSWDWLAFWNIAAFLSVALAFMNILPIPALDGGHVLFLLYEVVFRRKPSEKFMERAQVVGMMLLLALLIYANGMDIVRLIMK